MHYLLDKPEYGWLIIPFMIRILMLGTNSCLKTKCVLLSSIKPRNKKVQYIKTKHLFAFGSLPASEHSFQLSFCVFLENGKPLENVNICSLHYCGETKVWRGQKGNANIFANISHRPAGRIIGKKYRQD